MRDDIYDVELYSPTGELLNCPELQKHYSKEITIASRRGNHIAKVAGCVGLAATLCAGITYAAGDGSEEPGFVAPPRDPLLPPAPPRTASSAETFIPGGCTTPMARTESKKPPRPPTLVTKLKG